MEYYGSQQSATGFQIQKLNSENYHEWRQNIKYLLMDRAFYGFIDGSEIDPGDSDAKKLQEYKVRRNKAMATICLTVEPAQRKIITEEMGPKEAWEALKMCYEPRSRARVAALRRIFYNMKMEEGEQMSLYLAKLRQAATELRDAGLPVEDSEVAYQMLDNLPKAYEGVIQFLYQLDDKHFTSQKVSEALLSEAHRIQHCKNNQVEEKEYSAAFAVPSDMKSTRSPNKNKFGHNKGGSKPKPDWNNNNEK